METAPERHPVRLVIWLVVVGLLTILNFAGRYADGDSPDDLAYRYSTAALAVVSYGILLVVVLLLALGLRKRRAFGLRAPVAWRRALGMVAGSLVAIYAIAFVFGLALSLFTDEDPSCEQGLAPTEWDPSRAGAFAAFAVTVVAVGPAVEELLYRGLGFGLLAPYGTRLAILVTGVLFGASHGLVYGFVPLVAFGIIAGWVRWRTQSTYPSMVLHATFNAVSLVAALALSSPC